MREEETRVKLRSDYSREFFLHQAQKNVADETDSLLCYKDSIGEPLASEIHSNTLRLLGITSCCS
jgi:hypothetical protein